MTSIKKFATYLLAPALCVGLGTTASHAAPFMVQPIDVTASSEFLTFGRAADNMINETGLSAVNPVRTGEPVPVTFPSHGTTTSGFMWTSEGEFQSQITFELGQVYALTDVHLWNSNSGDNDRGVQDVDVSFSTDGSTFSNTEQLTFAQGPNSISYTGETVSFSGTQNASFVRFDIVSTYGGNLSEISEVRFIAVPEPGSLALLASGGLLMLSRRRRAS